MIQYPTLTIAGLDNSGGAGLLADTKTFSAFGCYGMSAITLVAVQNSLGVKDRFVIDLPIIKGQIETIFEDMRPKAVKIGMLLNEEIILMVADYLEKNAQDIPIVLDPVMMCKGNISLLSPTATKALVERLVPLATIITPNIPEAMIIIGEDPTKVILSQEEIAQRFLDIGVKAAIIKGGHYDTKDSTDIFIEQGKAMVYLRTPRIDTPHTHGTGCTLSAATAAALARGYSVEESVKIAKNFLTHALASTKKQGIGAGVGPVDHNWFREEKPRFLTI